LRRVARTREADEPGIHSGRTHPCASSALPPRVPRIASMSDSWVLVAAFFSNAFTSENAYSMGLRSGE
jgi:hypothetical protein